MSNYRAWNAFVGEINRRPEFDGIRQQLLEAGRQVILNGAPSPLSATQAAQQPSAGGNGWAEALTGLTDVLGGWEIGMQWREGHPRIFAACEECDDEIDISAGIDLAELVRRAGEHTEVCR